MNKINIISILFLLILVSIKSNEVPEDYELAIIKSDNETLFIEAIKRLAKGEVGSIYIDTPVINFEQYYNFELNGENIGGIVGLKQSNGKFPILNFEKSTEKHGYYFSGINLLGKNKFIKYLIIENSGGYGVYIGGSNSKLEHVVTRYNYGTGININSYSFSLNYCYSYRNLDKKSLGLNANGFNIHQNFASSSYYVRNCFAWDNGNKGFYLINPCKNDKFENCASWNNGNHEVFSGKYDYDNQKTLDTGMWTIKEIMKADKNFAKNYNNSKFNLDFGRISGEPASDWLLKASQNMGGTGFYFENKFNLSASTKLIFDKNSAFDNKGYGFINVEIEFFRINPYFTKCVSFHNFINYHLNITPNSDNFELTDNWSWDAKSSNQVNMNQTFKVPINKTSATNLFYQIRDKIEKDLRNDFIPTYNFNMAINGLKDK